jgi:cell division septation protein DedD/phage FluMu protein Com
MTISFRCDCGRVLMASDEQGGLEGQCPACGEVMKIPQAEIVDMEEIEDIAPVEAFDEDGIEEEKPVEIKEVEDVENDVEAEMKDPPETRNWQRSSRFAMLASIVVVVIVALIVFMVVRKEKKPPEEVVLIQKIEPMVETEEQKMESVVETEEETMAVPVGARFEEEATVEIPEFQEVEPIPSVITEGESIEQVLTEPPAEVETEVGPSEDEQQAVASIAVETQPAEETVPAKNMPSAGSFTINVASFKAKGNAERYAEELKEQGIDAFDWEITLPEKGRWYRVSVGGFASRQEAEDYASDLRQKGITDIFITQIPGAS